MRVEEGYGMINYPAGCHKLRKLKLMGANDDCVERLNVCLILTIHFSDTYVLRTIVLVSFL